MLFLYSYLLAVLSLGRMYIAIWCVELVVWRCSLFYHLPSHWHSALLLVVQKNQLSSPCYIEAVGGLDNARKPSTTCGLLIIIICGIQGLDLAVSVWFRHPGHQIWADLKLKKKTMWRLFEIKACHYRTGNISNVEIVVY